MSTKRVLSAVLAASAVILATGIDPQPGGSARALPPNPAGAPISAGAAIPYSGSLTDPAGGPVADGAYDFTFALYDAPEGGALLWSEIQAGVSVHGGTFTAALGSVSPLPTSAEERGPWLEVGVRGPGEAAFTVLVPRQAWSATASMAPASPSASLACAHDHLGENWEGAYTPGLRVYDTTPSMDAVSIEGATYSGTGVLGAATNFGTGVKGTTASGTGVKGTSTSGTGVMGTSTSWIGVYGSSSGTGVYGYTTNGIGVEAFSTSITGTALSIGRGAFRVTGAGVDSDTTVFKHKVVAGTGGNICVLNYQTVIDHPLTNGDPNAILIVTPNYGNASNGVAPPREPVGVFYDDINQCGFGVGHWVIYNLSAANPPLVNGQMFNVMVIKP